MSQETIDLRKQHPVQLVDRMLFCQSLKEIGVEKIEALGEKYDVFLLPVEDEETGLYNVIDWEFVLFEATSHQMKTLLDNFVLRPKENNKDSAE